MNTKPGLFRSWPDAALYLIEVAAFVVVGYYALYYLLEITGIWGWMLEVVR